MVALVAKNLPANAGDIRGIGLIPATGRYFGEEMATHSSTLAWRTPWPVETGRLLSMGLQRDR